MDSHRPAARCATAPPLTVPLTVPHPAAGWVSQPGGTRPRDRGTRPATDALPFLAAPLRAVRWLRPHP